MNVKPASHEATLHCICFEFSQKCRMAFSQITTVDENGLQPTKWAKESSPGQSRGLDPCDALGQRITNDSPRVGVGGLPTPTRGENFGKYGLSTQGMAGGGARRHLACRLLLFARYALGYFPMALQAIFMKALWQVSGWTILLLVFLIVCPRSFLAQRNPLPPVILISVDTLRADHLSCYGYKKFQTPNIDHMVEGGTRFSQVNSQVPLTLPSHVSMLTSTLPLWNGVQDHGQPLDARCVTLASLLKSRGYRTGAFVGGFVLDKRFGLNRGFDVYDSPFNLRRLRRTDPGDVSRPGEEVVKAATAWLQAKTGGAFFLFLHLYDLHAPYGPHIAQSSPLRRADYDAALLYEDAVLGRFWGFLKTQGLLERSLIVFTSDHGESLWEHGESTHGYFIYQSTLRVPLIFHWPAGNGSMPSTVDEAASLVDVAPTILQFLGISRPAEYQGKGLLEPTQSPALSRDREIYSESVYARNHFGCARLRSLRIGRYKYIDAPKPEFYDLIQDPGEKRNLYSQQKAVSASYRERLQTLQSRFQRADSKSATAINPEVAAALGSLGYVAVSTVKPADPDAGADPKDRIADFEAGRRALELSGVGRTVEAQALLEPLCSKYPEVADLQISLGLNLRRLGRGRESVEVFRRVMKQDPLNVRGHFDLGVGLYELRQLDEALKELQAVLALSPTYNQAQELQGVILLEKGDERTARSLLDQLLKVEPDNYAAHYHLGMLAIRGGNWLEAERHLENAARLDPLSAEAQNGLGVVYLQTGRLEMAQRVLEEAIRLEPKWAETHFNLGLVFRQLSQKDRAVHEFREALAVDPQFRPAREALDNPEFRTR